MQQGESFLCSRAGFGILTRCAVSLCKQKEKAGASAMRQGRSPLGELGIGSSRSNPSVCLAGSAGAHCLKLAIKPGILT